uniref:Uncharacterized protein n=1 Tax=Panagrolaimus sp. ES5 TaxID=591445 RepID=A0AC34G2D3_9BILA
MYQTACTKLRQDFQESATNVEMVKHCEKFLESYFMIPPLWYDFLKLLKSADALPYLIENYSYQALQQFYSEEFTIVFFLYKISKNGISTFDSWGNPLPPRLYKVYTKSKKIYDKLCEVYENEAKWIKVLPMVEDDDYIKQNIEARIAREYTNKKLWRLYFQYLDDKNDMSILSIFCRYCNFSIEDLGMREKYLAKLEYFAGLEEPVSKWWIDVIAFTFNHGTAEDIKEIILKALSLASVDFLQLHMFLEYDLEEIVPKENVSRITN